MARRRRDDDEEFEPVKGTTIRFSRWTCLANLVAGAFFLAVGVVLCVMLVVLTVEQAPAKEGSVPPWLAGGMGAVVAVITLIIGAGFLFVAVLQMYGRARFVMGKRVLQWYSASKLKMHLPYDNIKDIRIKEVTETSLDGEREWIVTILVMDVDNPRREDTLFDRRLMNTYTGQEDHDIVIQNEYRISLKKFYSKLLKKWRPARLDSTPKLDAQDMR